ncbi:uncharacterized protein P174DRAFT_451656 [Aspergillus novofumigatus IBT 16806]|uniref:Uncharacterized protein n=1 Tax=Aspergillus novofumigatus (strain IBT 16806) TaxID=1392255 RepID=A0A2I1C3Q9_ASPN1|nr:uncharacterized protein P174DRAFT_451656 [Aspergillus novofumigatus IBT 16806]PKX92269.1 hypothetical protein P174DRAFT_451656 [Aspergillus novofumigatus IBT 16806]
MTRALFFCIAEDAKPFVPKALREFSTEPQDFPYWYYLVESRVCPDSQEHFRSGLQDGEFFESDFINASKEECQNWAIDKWRQPTKYNFIEQEIVTIADARSAKDGTLLMSYYYECPPGVFPVEFDEHGPLPPKNKTWYDFRIHHTDSEQFQGTLLNAEPDVSYPLFFGYPEKFTNEAGAFEMRKVEKFLSDGEV